MRDFTATGFFTTKWGIKTLASQVTRPTNGIGVPADVLKQYGMENLVV
jgi:hypothetical protein